MLNVSNLKQVKLLFVSSGFAFLTFGCQKENIEPRILNQDQISEAAVIEPSPIDLTPEAGKNYYFYEQSDLVPLGKVSIKKVIIGFPDEYTTEQKELVIAKYPNLGRILSDTGTGSADATIVEVKEGNLPGQVEATLDFLKLSPEVLYANPVFKGNESFDFGISNQFIITLNSEANLKKLQDLALKTKTRIVEAIDKKTYILSADKSSSGDALAMSNYFYKNGGVKYSEPDFLMIATSSSF